MSHSINGHFTPASLLKFAAPSIIMMMFMSLYTIIDGIFISRFVGSNALSSLNIVYPVINIVFAIGTMLGTGGNAIISRYMGEGKDKEARECMTQFVAHQPAHQCCHSCADPYESDFYLQDPGSQRSSAG